MLKVAFIVFAIAAISGAVSVVFQRQPLYSVLSLVVTLISLAAVYVTLQAQFIAAVQVIVYAGAIMVLFVFVIMLLNLPQDEDGADRLRWLKFIGIPLGLFFLFLVGATVWNVEPGRAQAAPLVGSPQAIGQVLFTDYLLPFEATSLLILIALIGAVVFAKKDL